MSDDAPPASSAAEIDTATRRRWADQIAQAAGGSKVRVGLYSVEAVLGCPQRARIDQAQPFIWTTLRARRRLASRALEVLRSDRRHPTPHEAVRYVLGDLEPGSLRDWIDALGPGGRAQLISDVVARTISLTQLVAFVPPGLELNPSVNARCGAVVLDAQCDVRKGNRFGWCLDGLATIERARRHVAHLTVVSLLAPQAITPLNTVLFTASGERLSLQLSSTELESWVDAISHAASSLVLLEEAPRNGGQHCRWCHEKFTCPANTFS
jgi:hypothetical protein